MKQTRGRKLWSLDTKVLLDIAEDDQYRNMLIFLAIQTSSELAPDSLRLKIFSCTNYIKTNQTTKHTTIGLIAKRSVSMLENNCIMMSLRPTESYWRKVFIPHRVEWISHHETSLQEWKFPIPKIPNKWKTILKWFATKKSLS